MKKVERITGKIKWFDDKKGFGFIVGDDGNEYFLHYSNIEMEGHKTLEKGDSVSFESNETDKGLSSSCVQPLAE